MALVPAEVVKIGGSLLVQENFALTLRQWLDRRAADAPRAHRVLLVGGGAPVEALRRIDHVNPLPETSCHWRAIELMEISGRLVSDWIPELHCEQDFAALLQRRQSPGTTLFFAAGFLRKVEPTMPGGALPAGWHVTSDSIAARLAEALGAFRLTLLKSAPPPSASGPLSAAYLAKKGYVDSYFPQAAARLENVEFSSLSDDWGRISHPGPPKLT